jgi:hypothetical protein
VLPDMKRWHGPAHPKTRQLQDRLRHDRGRRIWRVNRATFVAAVLAATALATAALVAASALTRGHTLGVPPAPGYESPANAVAGYMAGLFTDRPAAACRYVVPGQNDVCTLGLSIFNGAAQMSGTWTAGDTATSRNRAIVSVEYEAQTAKGASVVNTDPSAGLPHAGLSFAAAFQQALTSSSYAYAIDCTSIGGRWYVDGVTS